MQLKPSYKARLICLLIASPSIMSLNAFGQPCCVFNGYNIGGGLGIVNFTASMSSDVSQNGLVNSAVSDLTNPGVKGNLFVGYTYTPTNWLVLGAELGVNIVSRKQITLRDDNYQDVLVRGTDFFLGINSAGQVGTHTNFNDALTASRNLLEPTLDLKAGILITPNLETHGRVGVGYNRITLNANSSFSETAFQEVTIPFFPFASSSFAEMNAPFKTSKNRNVFPLRVGFGLTGMLTPNIGVSGDYIYSFYNTSRINRTNASRQISCDIIEGCTVNENGTYQNRSKARVSDQEILMNLVYYFNC